MSLIKLLTEPVAAISVLLNPDKRKERLLRRAIEAAEEIIKVLKREGRYKTFPDKKLIEYEQHYRKQFDAWKNGV